MDHVRLYPMRLEPASQPEAVTAGFEGQCNPRDLAAGLDRLVAPAMQQAKQPFWTRLQLLARLTLNAGKHTGNQPTRLAHLDDGNDRAILIQGDEGPAQVVRLGHRGTPSVHAATMVPSPRRLPHSISRSHSEDGVRMGYRARGSRFRAHSVRRVHLAGHRRIVRNTVASLTPCPSHYCIRRLQASRGSPVAVLAAHRYGFSHVGSERCGSVGWRLRCRG